MELSSLLHHLHLSSSSPESSLPSNPHDIQPCPPITEVLARLQEKLIGAAEKASDPETTAVIGQVEQLFKIADPHWLFYPGSTNQSGGQQQSTQWSELEKLYSGLVRALTQCAALPLCDTDSGSLPQHRYQDIPDRTLPVCSALAALLGTLGTWERGTEAGRGREREGERDRETWPQGEREGEGEIDRETWPQGEREGERDRETFPQGEREGERDRETWPQGEREAGAGRTETSGSRVAGSEWRREASSLLPRPGPGAGFESRPGPGAGFESRPGPGAGFESRPGPGAGFESRPGPGAGFESRPRPRAGFESRPGPGAGFESRPGPGAGFESRPGPGTGFESRPEAPVSLVHTVAPLCCVFAVTHFQEQAWTSSASREAAGRLLGELLRAGRWRNPAHLLMGDGREEEEAGENPEEGGLRRRTGMLGGILDVLQPDLTKDRWQQCEAVMLVFSWSLLQVSRPSLSPLLPRLLPPSLLLSDHHTLENCMLGVHCLHHIVVNTPAADLRQYNRAQVLYQALIKHLYNTEATLTQLVLSCLLDLLLVLEKPPSPRKSCRHDDVLRLVLTHMEMEHKEALRRVYAAALPTYIDRMGVAVSRHLRRVERVVVGYLEVGDPPEERSRLGVLEALEKLLLVAWPRVEHRVCVLLRCLLRLLVDVSSDPLLCVSVKEQLTNQIARCLSLLDHCTHGKLQPLLQQVDSSCTSAPVLRCLATVTTATQR
ncbi:uncharacterized protein tti2 [Polymixia lowei]